MSVGQYTAECDVAAEAVPVVALQVLVQPGQLAGNATAGEGSSVQSALEADVGGLVLTDMPAEGVGDEP